MGALDNKYAIVTGGGTGIGLGIAERFLREGAASVLIAGRREEVLVEACEKLNALDVPGKAIYKACDVTNEEQIQAAVEQACDNDGQLDIMVANAGSGFPNAIIDADINAWRDQLELNVIGALICIKQAAQKMKQRGGSIVTISSVDGAAPAKFMNAYTISKAGQEMLVKAAAHELGCYGIRVNSIRPGFVPTELVATSIPENIQKTMLEETELGRHGSVEDIASATLHFASSESAWTTGQVLSVCGGRGNHKASNFTELAGLLYGEDKLKEYLNN